MKRLAHRLLRRVNAVGRALEQRLEDPASPSAVDASPPVTPGTPEPMGRKMAYAHWGEDLVVQYLLDNKRDGFYVDVGCFHPSLYSNTKVLFDSGWRGVNIDPNPFMIDLFQKARPNDENLHLALSDVSGTEIDFFIFSDWGSSNTASPEFAAEITRGQKVPVTKQLRVRCETLGNIFERYCASQTIDFLNIDVESLDLKVLRASDWDRFRPHVIAIEDFQFDYAEPTRSQIYGFLRSKRYQLVSRNVYTSIFVSAESGITLYHPEES